MKRRGGLAALAITGRSALIGVALALCTLIPAAGWSQQIIEPHQPGWERWFKLDWEAGEWRGHPVVKGYLYNASPKTVGDVQLLVDALDAGGGIACIDSRALDRPRSSSRPVAKSERW